MPAGAQALDGNYRPINALNGTPVSGSATGGAALANSASLAATSAVTNYITGFVCTSAAPAGTVAGVVTVTGLLGGTLSFQFVETTAYGGELTVSFPFPIPATGVNQAITVSIPAITSGAVTAVAVWGFQL